ncbi:MAG: helix-turn-helix domain-containing protein [Deltaproteobacteria bacterium]|nr:helix-turn-helix domain-containing protein [Deltaproteobacteria bacterium]
MDTNPSKQRQQFYRDYASGQWSMSELCDRYQISRPTGYKWVDRIENEGLKAATDRSCAPFGHPYRTPERVEREVLAPSSEIWLGRHEASTDHRKKASDLACSCPKHRQRAPGTTRQAEEEPPQTAMEAPRRGSPGDGGVRVS